MAKTKFVNSVTIVTADIANSWYGGLAGTPEGAALSSNDVRVTGHVHDGKNADGHARKINLVSHVTGQLRTANIRNNAINTSKIANGSVTEAKLGTINATAITFNPSIGGILSAIDVQGAIDELAANAAIPCCELLLVNSVGGLLTDVDGNILLKENP